MIKQIATISVASTLMIGMAACGNKGGGYKKTENGLEYKIIKDEKEGESPKEGDMVAIHLLVHIKDSVAVDTRKMNGGQPVELPVMPAQYKGDWTEGLKLMTPGDSAEFLVPVDTLMKINPNQPLPAWMKKGEKVAFNVKLVSVQKAADAASDDKLLQDYFSKNNIHPQKSSSGVYFVINKEGTGNNAQPGQMVTVNYTGKTLDGKTFDSNIDPQFNHAEPLKFVIGMRQVIQGWEEGLKEFKKGSSGTLYIPSGLAYGTQSPGPGIPANSILMFDIEVLDIAEGPDMSAMQGQ